MNAKTILLPALFVLLTIAVGTAAQDTGTLAVRAAYSDGAAVQGFVEIFRVHGESLVPVSKQPLINGKVGIDLPAGDYAAAITTSGEIEPQVARSEKMAVEVGKKCDWTPVLGRARVEFLAQGGTVEATITVMRHSGTDKEGNDVWRTLPRTVDTTAGRATIALAPGKYRISYVPRDIIGCPVLYEDMDLADKEIRRYEPTIAHGALVVEAKDFRGPVPARITIYAARQGGRNPAPQFTCAFDGKPLELRLQPARYSIDITADTRAIIPPTSQTFEPVKVASGGKETIAAYFRCGRVKIDCPGAGDEGLRVELHSYDEATKGYTPFDSLPLKAGLAEAVLAEGKYRVIVADHWVSPQKRYQLPDIDLREGQTVARSCNIQRGEICVVAELTKKIGGTVALFRKEGAVETCITTWPLADGEKLLRLPAGTYRLVTTVQNGGKLVDYTGKWRMLEDKARIMVALDLKSLTRDDSPLINIIGPEERGDGDAKIEVGETIRVHVGVDRAPKATTTVSVIALDGEASPDILGNISGDSDSEEFETSLNSPGRYAVVVKTRDDHSGRETVVKKEFTVVGKD